MYTLKIIITSSITIYVPTLNFTLTYIGKLCRNLELAMVSPRFLYTVLHSLLAVNGSLTRYVFNTGQIRMGSLWWNLSEKTNLIICFGWPLCFSRIGSGVAYTLIKRTQIVTHEHATVLQNSGPQSKIQNISWIKAVTTLWHGCHSYSVVVISINSNPIPRIRSLPDMLVSPSTSRSSTTSMI